MMIITRRRFLISAVSPLAAVRLQAAENTTPVWQPKLEAIRIKHGLPGLGGAIITGAGLQSQAVCGVRKAGTEVAVQINDQWHLGSNTKAITSTLAAIAVDEGKLKWDSTLGDVFPKQQDLKKSPLAKATLTQLLSHWSGLPANAMWGLFMISGGDLRAQRETALTFAARTPICQLQARSISTPTGATRSPGTCWSRSGMHRGRR